MTNPQTAVKEKLKLADHWEGELPMNAGKTVFAQILELFTAFAF
jgi:hypothetical protein